MTRFMFAFVLAGSSVAAAAGFDCSHLPADPYHMGGDLRLSVAADRFSFQLGRNAADVYVGLQCVPTANPFVFQCSGHDPVRGRTVELTSTVTASETILSRADGSLETRDERYVRVSYRYLSDDRRDIGSMGAQYPLESCASE